MSEPDATPTSVLGGAPPTRRGEVGRAGVKTAWPSVLGSFVVMLGVIEIGVACVCVLGWSVSIYEETQWDATLGELRFSIAAAAHAALSVPVAALAVAGGLGLVARRRWGVRAVRWWSVAQVALGWAAMFLFIWSISEIGAGFSGDRWEERLFFAWVAGTAAWLVGWPLFVGLWLMRRRIREEVGAWR